MCDCDKLPVKSNENLIVYVGQGITDRIKVIGKGICDFVKECIWAIIILFGRCEFDMPAKLLLQILMAFFIQSAILSLEFSYVTKDLVVDHFDDMKGMNKKYGSVISFLLFAIISTGSPVSKS